MCLVRKSENKYLPQILGIWNSKNVTSCAGMYLYFTYMLSIQEKTYFQVVKTQKVIVCTCNMHKKKKKEKKKLT